MSDEVASVDDLYGLEPGEFVAARDALARRLRSEGDREQATAVKHLRRPSATVAALNRAARQHPDLLADALEAGERLRRATEAAMDGDVGDLRDATTADRTASGRFLKAAGSLLGSDAADVQQRMAATLRAAAVDDEVADRLRRGVLVTDHEPSGFGFGIDGSSVAQVRPSRKDRADARGAKVSKGPGAKTGGGKQQPGARTGGRTAEGATAGGPTGLGRKRATGKAGHQEGGAKAGRATTGRRTGADEATQASAGERRALMGEVARREKSAGKLDASAGKAEERASQARATADRLSKTARAADTAATEAEETARAARAAAAAAEAEALDATRAADDAEGAARTARAAAQEAAEELDRARAELDEVR